MKKVLLVILGLILLSGVFGCGGNTNTPAPAPAPPAPVLEPTPVPEKKPVEEKVEKEAEEIEVTPSNIDISLDTDNDKINPEFKAAMEAYEAFFDEYVEFMKKYNEAEALDTLEMLEDMMAYMELFTETMEKLDAINENEVTTAEWLLYLEVMIRINKKLADMT